MNKSLVLAAIVAAVALAACGKKEEATVVVPAPAVVVPAPAPAVEAASVPAAPASDAATDAVKK